MVVNELGLVSEQLTDRLAVLYGQREAFLMAAMCLEKLTGIAPQAQKRAAATHLTPAQLVQLRTTKNNSWRTDPFNMYWKKPGFSKCLFG